MVAGIPTSELKIVREADGLEVNMLPLQGLWTEQQYLRLSDQTNHLIEYTDGVMELLPRPTERHQAISQFLLLALLALVAPLGGKVHYAPLRLRVREGKFREPDLLLLLDANDPRRGNAYWLGADLVVEIVSPDDRERDTVAKRTDYAEAGIPEYWIVDPEYETVTVLRLDAGAYAEHGIFRRGSIATSTLLPSLSVPVSVLLDAS